MSDFGKALSSQDEKAVSALLRAGYDPNSCIPWDMGDFGGQCKQVPLLSIAIIIGNTNIFNLLLHHKVQIEEQGDCPDTPLVLAAKIRKREKFLMRLLEADADPMVIGKEGLFAIHWAAAHGNLKGVKELHSKGCDLNVKSFCESTPLHWATKGRAFRTAKWMVSQGANPSAEDLNGDTPADYAMQEGNKDIADWLKGITEPTIKSIKAILGTGVINSEKKVFVFNFENFKENVTNFIGEEAKRNGAHMDAQNINSVFTKLNYRVGISQDLTGSETEDTLNEIQKDISLKALIIIILSHGKDSNTFWTSDGDVMDLSVIQNKFTDKSCPHLKGLEKVIMANFCRGQIREMLDTDGRAILFDTPHHMATIYACHAGFVAMRHRQAGTIFVTSICNVLKTFPDITLDAFFNKLYEEMKRNSGTTPQIIYSPPSISNFKF